MTRYKIVVDIAERDTLRNVLIRARFEDSSETLEQTVFYTVHQKEAGYIPNLVKRTVQTVVKRLLDERF